MNSDRRRLPGPSGPTRPPVYASALQPAAQVPHHKRVRQANEPRRICEHADENRHSPQSLTQARIVLHIDSSPKVPASAFLELQPSEPNKTTFPPQPSPKVSVNILGPKPMPRNAPFSPTLHLTSIVKFAPFALPRRTAHIRGPAERDLSAHLETALRGTVLLERYPKAALDVCVTVLECEAGENGMFALLASAITAAGAALVQAGIECVDIVAGGVAGLIALDEGARGQIVVDPASSEHEDVRAHCCVGYLAKRDELVEIWQLGDAGEHFESLVDGAIDCAKGTRSVVEQVVKERHVLELGRDSGAGATDATAPNTNKRKDKSNG